MENKQLELWKQTYDKHLNLKLAAEELGIKWQTLYYHLNKNGHPIKGNKEVYGSATDKLARYTEKLFNSTIPYAKDLNDTKFQAKLDFSVKGYKVDVKSSTKKVHSKNNSTKREYTRWAFSCKVQEKVGVDFLVCYCYSGVDSQDFGTVEKILLIPDEFVENMQSISVSCDKSKWLDFELSEGELREFFDNLE